MICVLMIGVDICALDLGFGWIVVGKIGLWRRVVTWKMLHTATRSTESSLSWYGLFACRELSQFIGDTWSWVFGPREVRDGLG